MQKRGTFVLSQAAFHRDVCVQMVYGIIMRHAPDWKLTTKTRLYKEDDGRGKRMEQKQELILYHLILIIESAMSRFLAFI